MNNQKKKFKKLTLLTDSKTPSNVTTFRHCYWCNWWRCFNDNSSECFRCRNGNSSSTAKSDIETGAIWVLGIAIVLFSAKKLLAFLVVN
jgi:hypothetical protein